MRLSALSIALFTFAVFTSCSSPTGSEFDPEIRPGVFRFDFKTGWQGWEPIFVWIPLDKETGDPRDAVGFKSDHRSLPDEVEEKGQALFAHGSAPVNMFFKHRIEGLKPGTTYRVHFDVEIASNVGEGCYGIGGSPGSTTIYAASLSQKPTRRVVEDFYVFDEATTETLGLPDGPSLGTITNGIPCEESMERGKPFRLKSLSSGPDLWTVTTDEEGETWLLVGSRPFYNGKTTLYYNEISARFEEVKSSQ